MKKFIYLSIILATLSLSSFISRDKIYMKATKVQKIAVKSNSKIYVSFDSSIAEIGDPVKPHQE